MGFVFLFGFLVWFFFNYYYCYFTFSFLFFLFLGLGFFPPPLLGGHRDTLRAVNRPLSLANKYISSQLRCIILREIAGIPAPVYFGAEISHPSRSAGPCGAAAGRASRGAGTGPHLRATGGLLGPDPDGKSLSVRAW